MVSDVRRHGEWSPVCTGCTWDEGDGPVVGARFTGTNSADGRTWETRSVVVAAEPGVEFAWQVNEDWVRWGFTTEGGGRATPGSTVLTESWEFLPAGLAGFRATYGAEGARTASAVRARQAHDGVPATLAAVRAVVEAEPPAGGRAS